MTLFELQEWLGHRTPEATAHYAKLTPNTLARAYNDAGYFARNVRTIEVLVDRDAVTSGAAASGEPWQYYDLGHGWCTYTFFEQCQHRMACARCDFYCTPRRIPAKASCWRQRTTSRKCSRTSPSPTMSAPPSTTAKPPLTSSWNDSPTSPPQPGRHHARSASPQPPRYCRSSTSGILLVYSRHEGQRPGFGVCCTRWSGLAVVSSPRPGRGIGYVMCMQPAAWPEPDPQIAAAIAAKYRGRRPRPLAVQIRDRLGQWLDDEDFAAAFGTRGRPGWSPSRLALVTVLQRAENLPGRAAAEAARTRIGWQYLLGLPLDDPGFDATVLAEFRTRVADAGLEQVVLDALLERLAADGLVKAGGKQRTDSAHVVAAVAALNRLELAGESVRAVLEALAAAHPDWLEQRICVSDSARRYGTPVTSWHPPLSQAKRDELAIACARDGYALPEAVYDSSSPAWLREIPAVDVLRRVLVQNYTRVITGDGREVIRRREKEPEGDGLPPGHTRIASPCDLDARRGVKRDTFWLGCKLHITGTCDDPPPCSCRPAADGGHGRGCAQLVFPDLITHAATTGATVNDSQMTAGIHDALAGKNLCPGQDYPDSGYLSAEAVLHAARSHGITLTGPMLAGTSPQARAGGCTQQAFTIDWDLQQVTCPEGAVSSKRKPMRTRDGKDAISVRSAAATCRDCPARDKCTTAVRTGRQLYLRPREIHQALADARAAEDSTSFQAGYNRRAGVEGTMHQAASHGARRARYRGLPKTRLDHAYMACALNLIRLEAYWTGTPLDRQRTSHLARLELSLAA